MKLVVPLIIVIVLLGGCVELLAQLGEGGSDNVLPPASTPNTGQTLNETPDVILPAELGGVIQKRMPEGISYDEYVEQMDTNHPHLDEFLGCTLEDDSCFSSKTNAQQVTFGTEVKVTVPTNAMLSSLDLTPTVEGPNTNEQMLYSFEFPDAVFLEKVTVSFPWPEGLPTEGYFLVQDRDGEYAPAGPLKFSDGTASFKADHFSGWGVFTYTPPSDLQEVKGKLTIDLGSGNEPIKRARFRITDKEGSEHQGITDKNGEFTIRVSPEVASSLDQGLQITLEANNNMISVRNPETGTYTVTSTLKNEAGQAKSSFKPTGDAQGAFKVIQQASEVRDFWESKNVGTDFLLDQIIVVYPDEDGSYYWVNPYKMRSEMGLKQGAFSDFQKNDGNGDSFAHEYTHYATKWEYGGLDWLLLSTSSAQHKPGDAVKATGDAFKEDIAYFAESVYDGMMLPDLSDAEMNNAIPPMYEQWDIYVQRYSQATGQDKEAVKKIAMEYYERNNPTIVAFNEDHSRIDGFGGRVMWDLYQTRGASEFHDIWTLIVDEQPKSFMKFAEEYKTRYGQARFDQLNASITKFGGNRKWDELNKFWEAGCLSSRDCSDSNPCTNDYCMENGILRDEQGVIGKTCYYAGDCKNGKCISEKVTNPPDYSSPAMSYFGVDLDDIVVPAGKKVLCCDYGEKWLIVDPAPEVDETLGEGIKKSTVQCCDVLDCFSGNLVQQTYESWYKPFGWPNARCENNVCVYYSEEAYAKTVTA